jgi:phosphinothricin acetyltransferase
MMIRSGTPADAAAICAIYNHYVLETTITFEEAAVSPAEMENRIRETLSSLPWLLWEQDGSVCGYACSSKWKGRCAYRHSAEVTVYLDPAFTGRGIGSKLFEALLADLRERGFHTAIGGIALPNPASIEQVGWKFGRWIDVGYWQLLL